MELIINLTENLYNVSMACRSHTKSGITLLFSHAQPTNGSDYAFGQLFFWGLFGFGANVRDLN